MIGKVVAHSVQKVAETVVDGVLSIVQSTTTQYRSVEEDIECLKRLVLRINVTLADAEECHYINKKATNNLYFCELKGVKLSAEILLDEYEAAFGVPKHDSSSSESLRKRKWYHLNFPSVTADGALARRRSFAAEIAGIKKRFEEIIEHKEKLVLRGEDGLRLHTPQTVGPEFNQRLQALEDFVRGQQTMMMRLENLTKHEPPHSIPRLLYSSSWSSDHIGIVGRQNEINHIVDQLVSDCTRADNLKLAIPVVPIHGPPGIGKTVLAKMVFNDKRVSGFFDFKAWVTLTNAHDVRATMEEIYQKMTGRRCNFTGNDVLQNLGEYLKTRQDEKFFLVIDHLCGDTFHHWETLQMPLLAGGERSKVLITTRDETISRALSPIPQPRLSGLDEEECWQIIQCRSGIVNFKDERLVPIGKEIAKRCNGFPMAAANLGAILTGKGEGVWSDVLCRMRILKDEPNVVLASLRVQHHHLPYHLKQCFNSCSIFPKDHPFGKNQVIEHWKALGLIPAGNGHQPEAIGMSYFDDLISRSFFQKISTCYKDWSEKYILPSLMYDLVMLNAKQEYPAFNRGLVFGEPQADPARYHSALFIKDDLPVNIDLKQHQAIREPLNTNPASSSDFLPGNFISSNLRDEVSRLHAPHRELSYLQELVVVQNPDRMHLGTSAPLPSVNKDIRSE